MCVRVLAVGSLRPSLFSSAELIRKSRFQPRISLRIYARNYSGPQR